MNNQNKIQRNCPSCGKILSYSNKYNCSNAEKLNKICKKCSAKEHSNRENVKLKKSLNMMGDKNPMYGKVGNLNPFFGKTHTIESKIKMIENRDMSVYQSDEFREKMSKVTKGINNPMFGRSVYSVWIEKYGNEIANEKMKNYKLKQSENNKGSKNSMYGKPSPNGSGNGWSGWYRGWYFRSLKELSYMINVIERFNLYWESAESKEFTIMYKNYEQIDKTYRADFIINNKYMVEIKPKKLWNTINNNLKKEAAIKFCELNGLKYKITDIDILSYQEILDLYNRGLIQFIDRYADKLKKYSS